MNTALLAAQIVVSVALILAVLVQVKGTGFGKAWGSDSISFTRRGLERLVFKGTFVLTAIFIVVSILQLVI